MHNNPDCIADRNKIIATRLGKDCSVHTSPGIDAMENLLCELIYALHIEEDNYDATRAMPKVVEIDKHYYISNNPATQILDWRKGLIHVQILDLYKEYISKIDEAVEGDLLIQNLDTSRHVAKELPNTMEQALVEELKEVLRAFARINENFKRIYLQHRSKIRRR